MKSTWQPLKIIFVNLNFYPFQISCLVTYYIILLQRNITSKCDVCNEIFSFNLSSSWAWTSHCICVVDCSLIPTSKQTILICKVARYWVKQKPYKKYYITWWIMFIECLAQLKIVLSKYGQLKNSDKNTKE